MNIIEHNWAWAKGLSCRPKTEAIVLHHAAAKTASPEDVHAWHIQNGWAGIGYHLYVRKDGSVHAGRPLWASGAHTLNFNGRTLGICCEGNYDVERDMPPAQLQALRGAIAYLRELYPDAVVKCHRDYNATACPGRYFPFAAATEYITGGASPAPTNHPGSAYMPVGEGLAPPAVENDNTEEDAMQRYNKVSDLPEAYRADVQTLIDKGFLRGKGGENALDLTEDMARVLIICARMEGVVA